MACVDFADGLAEWIFLCVFRRSEYASGWISFVDSHLCLFFIFLFFMYITVS